MTIVLNPRIQSKECIDEIYWVNLQRTLGLATLLFVANFGLLYMDYLNVKRGFWLENPSYKTLFYSHMALGTGMLITLIIFWATRPLPSVKGKKIYPIITYVFVIYILTLSAYISGWVDQSIHGEITVFMIGCFTIATVYYLRPLYGLLIYLPGYTVFMIGVSLTQHNRDILQGYYINATLLAVVCYGLTNMLYKMKARDILHNNHLAGLVSERTVTLEEANKRLQMEIEGRTRAVDGQRQTYDKLLRLASIVKCSEDGIIGVSLREAVVDWNQGAAKIFGFSEQDIVGESFLRILPRERQEQAKRLLETIAEGYPLSHCQIIGQTRNGMLLDLSMTGSPIRNSEDAIIGISLIVRDVTAQNKLQREMSRLQQLNLLGEMAASISHEVRNPMTTVKGFLQLLAQKPDIKAYQDYFKLMIEELDRANKMLTEFLSVSRTKTAGLKECRLDQIVEQMLPLLQAGSMQVDMRLVTRLNPTPEIPLNEQEIRQVILNLARNGFEAMEPGGQLTVETITSENEVGLIVSDQGPGIPPDVLERLGTPFLSTKETGTGLGLAVCYGIIERHNGQVKVNTSSQGTTFSIQFRRTL